MKKSEWNSDFSVINFSGKFSKENFGYSKSSIVKDVNNSSRLYVFPSIAKAQTRKNRRPLL